MSYKITPRERFVVEKFPTIFFRILAYLNRQARKSSTGYKRPISKFRNPRTGPGRISILREFLSY